MDAWRFIMRRKTLATVAARVAPTAITDGAVLAGHVIRCTAAPRALTLTGRLRGGGCAAPRLQAQHKRRGRLHHQGMHQLDGQGHRLPSDQPLQIHFPVTWNVLALIARLSTRPSCTDVVCGKDSRHCAAPSAHC